MAVNWSDSVNTDFYNMTTQSVENVIEQEFESGKKRYYLKNSSSKKAFSFSLLLHDKTEEVAFWNWYDNKLLSRTQTFYLTDLISKSGTTEYRMVDEPALNNSQYPKECNLSIQEA